MEKPPEEVEELKVEKGPRWRVPSRRPTRRLVVSRRFGKGVRACVVLIESQKALETLPVLAVSMQSGGKSTRSNVKFPN